MVMACVLSMAGWVIIPSAGSKALASSSVAPQRCILDRRKGLKTRRSAIDAAPTMPSPISFRLGKFWFMGYLPAMERSL